MPAVQLSALLLEHDEVFEKLKGIKNWYIPIRNLWVRRCAREIPSSPFWWVTQCHYRWNFRLGSSCQFLRKTQENWCFIQITSFSIKVFDESINSYLYLINTGFVKNIAIAGFPGGGKIFVMMYIVIYALSKGLTVITVAMMCHRSIQLSGWHWHKILCIPVDCGNNMSFYRMIDLAIQKLERFTNIIGFIWSIHMIANDKIGQTTAKFDNMIDNIFKVVCGMNVHKGKKDYCNVRPNTTTTY